MLRKGQIVFGIILCFFLVGSISLADAFSIPVSDKKSSGSDRMDWGLIFVTSWDKCSSRNIQALEFYYFIAFQSIEQYNYDHALVALHCVPIDNYPILIKSVQNKVDLPIIVLDYRLSNKQRHSANELGHYSYYNVKNIVTQAKTLSIENKDTAWTLSHEIAHSSLDWLDYVKYDNVGYKWNDGVVHKVQVAYNKCKINDITLSSCQQLWNTARTPDGKYYPIMSVNVVLDAITDLENELKELEKKQELRKQELERKQEKQRIADARIKEAELQARLESSGRCTSEQVADPSHVCKTVGDFVESSSGRCTSEQVADPSHVCKTVGDLVESNPEKKVEVDFFSEIISKIQDFFAGLGWR